MWKITEFKKNIFLVLKNGVILSLFSSSSHKKDMIRCYFLGTQYFKEINIFLSVPTIVKIKSGKICIALFVFCKAFSFIGHERR